MKPPETPASNSVPPVPRMRGFVGTPAASSEAARPAGTTPASTAASVGTTASTGATRRTESGRLFMAPTTAANEQKLIRPAGSPGRATPLPKRPKGRLFIGGVLLAIFACGGYMVWNSLLRYDAYGSLTGRVIHISAAQGGSVHTLHVREGEHVAQGQVLVTLDNLELDQRLARCGDELLIAQANLDSEISKLQWQAQQRGDQTQRAAADYFELWGELAAEQAKLGELEARLDRDRALVTRGALSREQLEQTTFAVAGQEEKVAKLIDAVAERKKLTELSTSVTSAAQLKPLLVKIETLQTEIARLRKLLEQNQLRAPVAGRIVRSTFFTGEQIAAGEAVLELLERDSLEAVVYLPQHKAARVRVGDAITLQAEPLGENISGTVARFGEKYVTVPESLARHYHKSEQVLPVFIKLPNAPHSQPALRLGCEIRLPAAWNTRLFPDRNSLQTASVPK